MNLTRRQFIPLMAAMPGLPLAIKAKRTKNIATIEIYKDVKDAAFPEDPIDGDIYLARFNFGQGWNQRDLFYEYMRVIKVNGQNWDTWIPMFKSEWWDTYKKIYSAHRG